MTIVDYITKIISVEKVTHDVRRFKIIKPENYSFIPGQATDVAINKDGLKEELRPFTFTGLNEWDHLEFTIKIYQDHGGVTNELGKLSSGDELIIHEPWGAINYKGPGVFIAGGAGVTPFIAILRDLNKQNKINGNKLFFSNKTSEDVILEEEFNKILGQNFFKIFTREKDKRRIDHDFLVKEIDDFNQKFYVCGPDLFVKEINNLLAELGASTDSIVFEK